MKKDSRAKMVASAANLIRTRGVNATSFSEVVGDSGAPRGSIYHHFPQGKEQLAEDAIRWTSERVLARQRACPAGSPEEVLDWFVDMWRQTVIASGGAAGCVVAGVAVDTMPDAKNLMSIVKAAFGSLAGLLTEQFVRAGLAPDRARTVALAALAGMEGSLILCRAEGSVAPLEAVASELRRLVSSGPPRSRRQTPAPRPSRRAARSASPRNR